MNTHAEYARHGYHPPDGPAPVPDPEATVSPLARHRDPSLAGSTTTTPPSRAKGIAWVRPTELASFASPVIGRGIDLQAELVRQARRTPVTTTRSVRRTAHPPLHSLEPTAPRQEGLEL